MQRIVIVGGGFAGVWAAMAAAKARFELDTDLEILMVSKNPYLTVRPRLYEVPAEGQRLPLAPTLDPIGVPLIEASVTGVDVEARRLDLHGGEAMSYDRLVIATGSRGYVPPVPGLAQHAWNIDDYESAQAFDRHLAATFAGGGSGAERTVAVLGGGFTGLELVTELRSRIAHHAGEQAAEAARIVLIDRSDRLGKQLGEAPRPYIEAAIAAAAIETRLGASVSLVTADSLVLDEGERFENATVVATTGFRANLPFQLPGVVLDDLGRLHTDPWLRVEGVDGVLAAGDVARARVDDEHYALMSCQHAIPMGRIAGHNAVCDLLGRPLTLHAQDRYVTCLDLGSAGAIFTTGWERTVRLSGAEGKARKREINEVWISPPQGTREEIFASLESGSARRDAAASVGAAS